MAALLETSGLTKRFGGLVATNMVDFAVERGERWQRCAGEPELGVVVVLEDACAGPRGPREQRRAPLE